MHDDAIRADGAPDPDDAVERYEHAPCGLLTTAPDGRILDVNQTFVDWTGHDRTDLVGGRKLVDLLAAGGRIYHETHYAPMLQTHGRAREIALDIVTADGRRLPALLTSIVETDDTGAPRCVRVAVFDAGERREYERELIRARERAEESEDRARVLADTLQQTLIPPAPPDIEGIELGAVFHPAGVGEIGGDFYDVFEAGEGQWIIAIGDVQGKGVDAAVIASLARHTIRATAMRTTRLVDVLRNLDDVVKRDPTPRFLTVALVRLRCSEGSWRASVACGGHPLPILVRPDGTTTQVSRPGPLVGILPAVTFAEDEVELRAGDALLLYTDGVTEARRGDTWFGQERLVEAIAEARPSAWSLADTLHREVLAFQDGQPRDDIAIVTVRVPSD